jgi:hypothetical protein
LFSTSPVRGYTSGKNEAPSGTFSLPPSAIALLAVAVHGPLLLMQLPAFSAAAQTQMFLAQNYASNWSNPWNPHWFGGFSQTAHAPLTQQVVALLSHALGITAAYMVTQLLAVILLTLAVYRFARLWTNEGTAVIASIGSIFLGSLGMLIYREGALPVTAATALALYGVVFLYGWSRATLMVDAVKAVLLLVCAAACDHITAMFGVLLFALPTLFLASRDASADERSSPAALIRGLVPLAAAAVISGFILAPLWASLFSAPHHLLSADATPGNLLLNGSLALQHWLVPVGLLVLALPYLFFSGFAERRMRPLFIAFYVALIVGLGATTPVAKIALGRFYQTPAVDTFTFWATLLALPLVAHLISELMFRYGQRAIIGAAVAAVLTFAIPLMWMKYHPVTENRFLTDHVSNFLNRDNHGQFRYLTLGFGAQFAEVSGRTNASTLDGAADLGPMLPEAAPFGVSHLDEAKQYGSEGMEALRAVLKHANQYGLKFIFVRDRYYEPLIAFAGWRKVEVYENGNVTLWSKEDVPPARDLRTQQTLPAIERISWSYLPMLCLLLALLLMAVTAERRTESEADIALSPTGSDPRLQEAI